MPRIGGHLPPPEVQPVWVKRSLDGVTILIVEEEPLIRLDLQQYLRRRALESCLPMARNPHAAWLSVPICQERCSIGSTQRSAGA